MAHGVSTVRSVLSGIASNQYLLPVIQRDFVWTAEQIESLFDSIMSGYPISSMLFWNYHATTENQYKFYEFLRAYDEYENEQNKNPEHPLHNGDTAEIVLDGQQRLTSLNIGLKGYMNLKRSYCRSDKADNYDKYYLFIDLLYTNKSNNDDKVRSEYCFQFKTDAAAMAENNQAEHKHLWFKMTHVLNADSSKDYKKILPEWFKELDSDTQNDVNELLYTIYQRFNREEILNYYREETNDFDRVLQIFVRINNGGTKLDYTDFLLSMIANVWSDARDEIKKVLHGIDTDFGFKIPKDIFLRSCLYLTNEDLNFKAKNFDNGKVKKIHSNFDEIVRSMRGSAEIFKRLGYSKENMRSNLILIPVAQFLMENKKTADNISDTDFHNIKQWIQLSTLAGVFGAQTTSYLKTLHDIIKGQTAFPLSQIKEESAKSGRPLQIDKDRLETLIDGAQYGSQNAWVLLTLLYPNLDYRGEVFHEDHIFPWGNQTDSMKKNFGNCVANLQLLRGNINQRKSDKVPEEWLQEYCANNGISVESYKCENYIPTDIELTPDNYDIYIERRRQMIIDRLCSVLGISAQ